MKKLLVGPGADLMLGVFEIALIVLSLLLVDKMSSIMTTGSEMFGFKPGLTMTIGIVAHFLLLLITFGVIQALSLRLCLSIYSPKKGNFSKNSHYFIYFKMLWMFSLIGKYCFFFVPVFLWQHIETLFGAKIGRRTIVAGKLFSQWLITIGDDCVIGDGSQVSASEIGNKSFTFGEVFLGNRVVVGASGMVYSGSTIQDTVTLPNGSVVGPNKIVKATDMVPTRLRMAQVGQKVS